MQGLYLITNDEPFSLLLDKLSTALATGHIELLQYRRKKIEKSEQLNEIAKILHVCDKYEVPLIINDDLSQAKHFQAHLHLGQSDGEIAEARAVLGSHAIIGRTCLNSLQLAQQAIDDGANYVAFGAIYGSTTKPEAKNIGFDILNQARQRFDIDICAIGGLTANNSQAVIEAGAHLCAVVSDILALPIKNIPERIEAWAHLFQNHSSR